MIEVRHLAIRNQTHPLRFEPCLQGQNQGVLLVVDRSLDAGKRFNTGKLQQEAEQVALEFNGTVPRLEGEFCVHTFSLKQRFRTALRRLR